MGVLQLIICMRFLKNEGVDGKLFEELFILLPSAQCYYKNRFFKA
jgi:hypothetical protein